MPCFYRNGGGADPAPKEFLTTYQQKLTKWKSNVLKNFISSHRINNKKQSNMKKNYYYLAVALATGLLASCSNEITEEITPGINTEVSENLSTRAFPTDDGAKSLPGQPAQKLHYILLGADSAFSARLGNFSAPSNFQYEEIKEFTDELVAEHTTNTQKYKTIYDWVRQNVKYANGEISNEPYDVFINKQAVCQGYANLLNVMLHTQGIPVIIANGYLNSGAFMGHAWNYVYHNKQWWLSDPTNSMEYKSSELSKYQDKFIPLSADGNFLETEQFSYNYTRELINLNAVNFADEAFVVPFSVTLNNGKKYQVNSFSPTSALPSNVKEIYIGKNITSIGQDGIYGLKDHAPSVEAAYVDPENQRLESFEGVVYERYNDAPVYIPRGMKTVYLKPTYNGTIGKNFLYNEPNIEEAYFPEGTTSLENWAVEKCPNLKVAYIPLNTEYDESTSFVDVHPDFKVVRMDMTGIKDAIAD